MSTGASAEEREAFASLVTSHADALYRYARTLVRDPTEAEDLVQEAFARAWQHRATLRESAAGRSWLRRILHNVAVDRFRHLAREDLVDDAERHWQDDRYTVDADAVAEQLLDRTRLEDALVHLPFVYREAVVLHDVEGLTAQEVAEVQGIGLPAAKQRLRRGRMALVSELGREAERQQALRDVVLRCWDARRLVSEYLDDELSAGDRRLVEHHLTGCPTCPPLYASLVRSQAALGGLRDPDSVVPPSVAARLQGAG
jgi:RNA polymerase sigma-70 factor, ECF subfamily